MQTFKRLVEAGLIHKKDAPINFINVARQYGIIFPDELADFIAQRATNEAEAAIETTELPSNETSSGKTRERDSLLKLVIGMAIKKYHYKPELGKNSATTNIANDLEELGIGLDQDTVRKYLNEAKGQLPDFDKPI